MAVNRSMRCRLYFREFQVYRSPLYFQSIQAMIRKAWLICLNGRATKLLFFMERQTVLWAFLPTHSWLASMLTMGRTSTTTMRTLMGLGGFGTNPSFNLWQMNSIRSRSLSYRLFFPCRRIIRLKYLRSIKGASQPVLYLFRNPSDIPIWPCGAFSKKHRKCPGTKILCSLYVLTTR